MTFLPLILHKQSVVEIPGQLPKPVERFAVQIT